MCRVARPLLLLVSFPFFLSLPYWRNSPQHQSISPSPTSSLSLVRFPRFIHYSFQLPPSLPSQVRRKISECLSAVSTLLRNEARRRGANSISHPRSGRVPGRRRLTVCAYQLTRPPHPPPSHSCGEPYRLETSMESGKKSPPHPPSPAAVAADAALDGRHSRLRLCI